MAGGIKAWRRRVWRKFLVRTEKTRRVFWRWFKRNSGKLTAILLIAWLCLIAIPPAILAQWVLDLWCRVFDFECWCWCWGADCVANAEMVRDLALVVVGAGLALAVREFLFRLKKTRQALGGCFKRNWQSLTAVLSIVMVSLLWSYWADIWFGFLDFWHWSRGDGGEQAISSNAETVRNLALGVGAIGAIFIGIPLALWRNILTHSQAKTAERDLNNERYQKGAEMLGSETLVTRMGGIYALDRLARDHPKKYHMQSGALLSAFIRCPTKYDEPVVFDGGEEKICSPAIREAAAALGRRSEKQSEIEKVKGVRVYLAGADLSRADLPTVYFSRAYLRGVTLLGADLRKADLSEADLSEADLWEVDPQKVNLSGMDKVCANLSGANLRRANLSGANLRKANLSDVDLTNTDLSGATLDEVENLTQTQLDDAFIWERRKPPTLVDAVDPETGAPLVWQGEVRPLSDWPSSET